MEARSRANDRFAGISTVHVFLMVTVTEQEDGTPGDKQVPLSITVTFRSRVCFLYLLFYRHHLQTGTQ